MEEEEKKYYGDEYESERDIFGEGVLLYPQFKYNIHDFLAKQVGGYFIDSVNSGLEDV